MTEKTQKIMDAFYKKYPDLEHHYIDKECIADVLREVINQMQVSPGVIICSDLLELCEELEKL